MATQHPYRGGRVFTAAAVRADKAPPGDISTFRLGQLVEAYNVYNMVVERIGEVVHIIDAGAKPDAAAMEVLFAPNKLATALKQPVIPTRPSKFQRIILKNRSGRCFAYVVSPTEYKFYPASTKEER